jgi:hypothetical protein
VNEKKMIQAAALFVGLAVLVAFAGIAWAQVAPAEQPIDPTVMGNKLVDAISGKEWGLALGAGLMLLIWFLRLFVLKALNTKVLPWISVCLGAIGAFAAAMIVAPAGWLGAIMAGIQAGLAAAGTWGLMPDRVKALGQPKP